MSEFKKVEKTLVSEEIYRQIKKNILNGKLPQGEKLLEAHIAEAFGTSQAPIRESLKRLEQDGLVQSIPYVGTYVVEVSDEEISEIWEIRNVLEKLSINRFVKHMRNIDTEIRQEKYSTLRSYVNNMKNSFSQKNYEDLADNDEKFHSFIVSNSGGINTKKVWQYIQQKAILGMIKYDKIIGFTDEMKKIVEAHEEMLVSIVNGDSKSAIDKYEEHMRGSISLINNNLGGKNEKTGKLIS